MKKIPYPQNGSDSLVLRTDFSDEAAWASICEGIRKPVGEFRAYVEFIDDQEFNGLTVKQLLRIVNKTPAVSFIFVVDKTSFSDPEQSVLVVDLQKEPGRTFRVIPNEIWGVENNLSVANMDFEEFADAVDADGVFRGFPGIE